MTARAWKNPSIESVARTDQAEGLRALSRNGGATRGPRFIAVTRVPWSDHTTLTEDLAYAMASLGRRVLVVEPPERASAALPGAGVRIESIDEHPEPGCVARIAARGPGPSGTGLRSYVSSLRDRFDTVLIDLGTAPDDIDLLGLTPRDELVFLAEDNPTVLFRTYALIKDLCVRRRVQTMHLLVTNTEDDRSARGMHRTLSAVAASFLKVSLRYLGSLTSQTWNAWCPPGVDATEARSRWLRDSDELRRIAVKLLDDNDYETVNWGGRGA